MFSKLQDGDKIWVDVSDGAETAGWVTFSTPPFLRHGFFAPCGLFYGLSSLKIWLWYGYKYQYLNMLEQLLATGELE